MSDFKRIPFWLAIAAVMTAATIVGHEIAHYIVALAMGAQDVALHWADVTFDETSLNSTGLAVTALAGPLFTHALILCVWISRTRSIPMLALGLGASSRDILLILFTLKTLLGRDVSGFSGDELRAAEALGITPLPFALLASILGLGGLIVFLIRAYRRHSALLAVTLFFGTFVGIVLWSVVGPMILAGGKGYG